MQVTTRIDTTGLSEEEVTAALHQAAHMEFTAELRALVQGLAPAIHADIQGALAGGGTLSDMAVWVLESGDYKLCHRQELAALLDDSKFPQSRGWVAVLSLPPPAEHFWLFISGDGSGACLGPARLDPVKSRPSA